MTTLGKRIKKLRETANLSQKELAKAIKVSEQSIYRYESDKFCPDITALQEISYFFNVSIDYLINIKRNNQVYFDNLKKKYDDDTFKEIYSHYLRCINDYEVDPNSDYFWIYSSDDCIGGQTQWVGYKDTNRTIEIRKLRPINPKECIELCNKVYGRPMVINKMEDVYIFLLVGNQALIKKSICEKYLPTYSKPYYCKSGSLDCI